MATPRPILCVFAGCSSVRRFPLRSQPKPTRPSTLAASYAYGGRGPPSFVPFCPPFHTPHLQAAHPGIEANGGDGGPRCVGGRNPREGFGRMSSSQRDVVRVCVRAVASLSHELARTHAHAAAAPAGGRLGGCGGGSVVVDWPCGAPTNQGARLLRPPPLVGLGLRLLVVGQQGLLLGGAA